MSDKAEKPKTTLSNLREEIAAAKKGKHLPELREDQERLERKGYGPAGRLSRKPISALTPREKLIPRYMVFGCDIMRLCKLVGRHPGDRWTAEEAADALKIKRSKLRYLQTQKCFQDELSKQINAKLTSGQAQALDVVFNIVEDAGDGTAADRKVQLSAAQLILRDKVGTPPANGPSVTINNGPVLQAGIVVRLPAAVADKLERNRGTKTIEAQAIEHAPAHKAHLAVDPRDMQQRVMDDADMGE